MQKSIKNYYQYFPPQPQASGWGFYLSAIGHTVIEAGQSYPFGSHPEGRHFDWAQGRILPTLQVVFVRRGGGRIEWARESKILTGGEAFVLLPGQWHRYCPDASTGWTEDWIELRGPLVERWTREGLFAGRLFKIADARALDARFDALHAAAVAGTWLSPVCMAGDALAILGLITSYAQVVGRPRAQPRHREIVAVAREQLRGGESIEAVAKSAGISYPTLHRAFVACTGMPPKEYAERLRLARAENLLCEGVLTIKEIAVDLGYHSSSHFSAAFKRVYGQAPGYWRETAMAGG